MNISNYHDLLQKNLPSLSLNRTLFDKMSIKVRGTSRRVRLNLLLLLCCLLLDGLQAQHNVHHTAKDVMILTVPFALQIDHIVFLRRADQGPNEVFLPRVSAAESKTRITQAGKATVIIPSSLYEKREGHLLKERRQEALLYEQKIQHQELLLWTAGTALILLGGLVLVFVYRLKKIKGEKANLDVDNKRLELVNNKLNRYTAVISHDVISNLDYVLSIGNLLPKEKKSIKELESFFISSQKVNVELKSYCLDLLKEAKREAVRGQVVSAEKVANLLGQVFEQYRSEFDRLGASVKLSQLSPTMLPVPIIIQIFHTLISNVLRHACSPKTPLQLSVGTTRLGDGRTAWEIADNGPGLSPDVWKEVEKGGGTLNVKKRLASVGHGVGLINLYKQLSFYGVVLKVKRNSWGGNSFLVSSHLVNENLVANQLKCSKELVA